ncbi:MAG TPA: nitrilase-related carbon-nitrogen hydrolase, partial [Gemmataceae bacterium]|nr:nitrilase-related carbon-nitrogen hydrolase [Gemmataceae bacterium]
MNNHGFIRVAAAVPALQVADCAYNGERILALMARAESEEVSVLVFPELALTGYTCGDLFQQVTLQKGALEALQHLAQLGMMVYSGIAIVGLPVSVDDQLFNCAAILQGGRIHGLVPKSFLPNYKEFYEERWFSPGVSARSREISLDGTKVPFGTGLLFESAEVEGLVLGVEICEDLWTPSPPSSLQAMHSATLLTNLSASNEIIGKAA